MIGEQEIEMNEEGDSMIDNEETIVLMINEYLDTDYSREIQ